MSEPVFPAGPRAAFPRFVDMAVRFDAATVQIPPDSRSGYVKTRLATGCDRLRPVAARPWPPPAVRSVRCDQCGADLRAAEVMAEREDGR